MSGICLSLCLKIIGLKIIKKKQKKENKLEDYSMYDYSEEREKLLKQKSHWSTRTHSTGPQKMKYAKERTQETKKMVNME